MIFTLILLVVLSSCCCCNLAAVVESSSKNDYTKDTANIDGIDGVATAQNIDGIVYNAPDLVVTTETPDGGEYQLEAYKSYDNDRLIAAVFDKSAQKQLNKDDFLAITTQMSWVSIGHPAFVFTSAPSSSPTTRLFHFVHDGFYSFINMLTAENRRQLAGAANVKYVGIDVTENQIHNLVLSAFECSTTLYDSLENSFYITGRVTDFMNFPLRIDFMAPHSSIERNVFVQLLNQSTSNNGDDVDLQFVCRMESRDRVKRSNTLRLDVQQMEQIGIVEKLFGQTEFIYVTHNQLHELANEMYATLGIAEQFHMSKADFVKIFINDLVSLTADDFFEMVPLNVAVNELSTYGTGYRAEDRMNRLIDDLQAILKIESGYDGVVDIAAGKVGVVVDEWKYNALKKNNDEGGNVLDMLGFQHSIDWLKNNSKPATDYVMTSVDEVLAELNEVSRNEIEWKIDGNRVLPNSINVAYLGRSHFAYPLIFHKIHSQATVPAFERQFSLYTQRAVRNTKMVTTSADTVEKQLPPAREIERENYSTMRAQILQMNNVTTHDSTEIGVEQTSTTDGR